MPGYYSEYPGGTVAVDLSGTTDTTALIIAFDEDEWVMSGNEYIKEINAGIYNTARSTIRQSFTWYAPEVPVGTYYVYCWADLNGNGTLDMGTDDAYVDLFSPAGEYVYNNQVMPYGIIAVTLTGIDLHPNYEFWEDFAPDIHFDL